MLKRVHVKGYKSLADVEVTLETLTVLFGPNAAGKSNFLDALQLLTRLGASRTLKDAFDPPYRGKPIESFRIGGGGIKGVGRTGTSGVLDRGGSAPVGCGGRGRRPADSRHAPAEPGHRGVGDFQCAGPWARARTGPALPHRDRDAAEIGHPARRRRVPRGPEPDGRTDRQEGSRSSNGRAKRSTCGSKDRGTPRTTTVLSGRPFTRPTGPPAGRIWRPPAGRCRPAFRRWLSRSRPGGSSRGWGAGRRCGVRPRRG